jgi:aminoglycoside phosphotransferase (APT) family kinase protein
MGHAGILHCAARGAVLLRSDLPVRLPVMARVTMHVGEVRTSAALARRLVARQFPQWAGMTITRVASAGTDHDVYRLGDRLVVRLPRIAWADGQARSEAAWLPRLAPHLPLAVPVPRALGEPDEDFPFSWAVHEWLPGKNAQGALLDLQQAAVDLAGFIAALRSVDTAGAPVRASGSRGGPLVEQDDDVRRCVAELGRRVDGAAALRVWDRALAAPVWDGPGVWVHGDLLPGNLLVVGGRLASVIDFGGLAVGDPACDLLPAWNVLDRGSRRTFRAELRVDDASWARGRGWALAQALIALPYYWTTNPGVVAQAQRALAHVLEEPADGPTRRGTRL